MNEKHEHKECKHENSKNNNSKKGGLLHLTF